jgi:hypothetical protein
MVDNAVRSDGDADRDGDVDGNDFLAWQRQLGANLVMGAASSASTVPEPAAMVLAACSVGFGLRSRRRVP